MNRNCYAVFLIVLVIISSNSKPQQLPEQNKEVLDFAKQNIEEVKKQGIDKSVKADRTIDENIYKKPSYDGGNGALIKYSKRDVTLTWLRSFKCEFLVEDYAFEEKKFLYKNPGDTEIVSPFYKNTKLSCSQILIIKTRDNELIECWFKVTDPKGNVGWVYGEEDPYRDNNWIVIGSVFVDNKKILIRKYEEWFSVKGREPAYDKPSYSGKIIWRTKRTDDNSQINLESICVTDKTFKGEHWVKAKDPDGRIGWFPGEKLDIERGGPKYLSPENISTQIFAGYD